jgi:hypothetical protein
MQALFASLALIAFTQIADGRYGAEAADADARQPNAIADAFADQAGAPAAPSEIAIAPEAAEPALAEGAAGETPVADPPAAADSDVAAPPAAAADEPGAAAAEPPASAAPAATAPVPKPADLMRALLSTPDFGQLAGLPTSLGAAMHGANSRADQTKRAQAYWDLSAAVAQYYLALLERDEIAGLRKNVKSPAAAWAAAAADGEARVEYARQAAVAAQQQLHRVMGLGDDRALPLPVDAPLCGKYNTRYDEIFASRQDPAAAQMDDLLPREHAELTALTRRVADAHAWLAYINQTRAPDNDGAGLLVSYQLMTEIRRTFVETVRQYNRHIAEYAELAAPDEVAPERVVAMLIKVSNPTGGAHEDSAVQPATAVEDADQPATDDQGSQDSFDAAPQAGGRERTFAFRPFERLRNRERSIVTHRRLLRLPIRDRN